jgi:hypothetical protein
VNDKPATPKLINEVCHIRRCEEPARYNFVTTGHPNGDIAASYCHEHHQHAGHWDDSPVPYSITITGPIGATE